jgi:AraC family transcriptional regulator
MTPISVWTKDCGDFVAVTLEPSFLFCAAHEVVNPTGFELQARLGVEDPLLRACLLALQREAQTGSPHGRLYAESVAATIAAHLVRHYSVQQPSVVAGRGGLSKQQLTRAIDYMQANLGEDVSLRSVAAQVGLSPFHFARLFKESTALTPHQYLIQCRVHRAKGLLQVADYSIGDVALQVGFCDQSHFSAHFKRVYGLTPRQFVRRSVRKRSCSAA